MSKRVLSCFYLLLLAAGIYAQTGVQQGKINLSGYIADSVSGIALAKASVTLRHNGISLHTNADSAGHFYFIGLASGKYRLQVSFIGYKVFTKDDILLDSESVNLAIQPVPLAKTLNTVVVTGSRQLIENKIDKIVFNVEKDISSQGGVATDALKKIPQVTVDADGNVELLGNPSIQFLIDGKPSAIFGNSVADALQSIPASQIQSIEVMTSPSSKYEATGTGGIINIILKKSKIQGFSANINLSAGSRLENGSVNAGWKKNKIGINGYYSGNAQLNALVPTGMDRVTNTSLGANRLMQQSENNFNRNGYKTGIGFDWAVSKTDNITASLGYNHFANNSNGAINQQLFSFDASGNNTSATASVRNFSQQFSVNTFDNSLAWKHNFGTGNRALEISYNGSFGRNNTYYNQSQLYKTNNEPFAGSTSLNPGYENAAGFAIDYNQVFKNNFSIETGVKTIVESIISNANVYTLNTTTNDFLKDLGQSYTSNYHRNISAGYFSASFKALRLFEVKAGARYEYTTGRAVYSNAGSKQFAAYRNLAPSVIVAHAFSEHQSLKFSYAYRIERPDFRDLNPFMNLTDPHNIITGNPALQPEIGNNFHLEYSISFDNGSNINLLLFYDRNSPDIKPYITYYNSYKIGDSLYNDVTVSSRGNIASEVKRGVNISLAIVPNKKLSIRGNIMLYDRHLNNIYDKPAVTDGLGFRGNVNASYQLHHNWITEAFGNYNLGMKWQGKQPSLFAYTFAARKQFNGSKGSIGLVVVNVFNKYIVQKSLSLAQNFVTNSYRDIPYRSFGISFTYKFGKLKFSKTKEADNYLYTPPSEN